MDVECSGTLVSQETNQIAGLKLRVVARTKVIDQARQVVGFIRYQLEKGRITQSGN